MEGVATVALIVGGVVIAVVIGIIIVVFTIRNLFRSVANRAVGMAIQAGERQLVNGATAVAKTVGEEIRKNDPARIEADVTRLAESKRGVVTVAEVMAACSVTQAVAEKCLFNLSRKGTCRQEWREATCHFVFAAFLPVRIVTACEFCGVESNDDTPGEKCPGCGAVLVSKKIVG